MLLMVLYLVDLNAEICGCPDFEHREENCKHIYAAAIASAKSEGCARSDWASVVVAKV